MGLEILPERLNGKTMDDSWLNRIRAILCVAFAPRGSDGKSATIAGALGEASLRWLRAHIADGYHSLGALKLHHSFNGTVGPGQGWMLCDGRQVTQAAYDAEHGAGSWATYVGSSPLANKYLPDLTDRYAVGASATPQTGASAISPVGVTDHTIAFEHNHQVMDVQATSQDDKVYNSSGVATDLAGAAQGTTVKVSDADVFSLEKDLYTSKVYGTRNVQPWSHQFQYYMRIVE